MGFLRILLSLYSLLLVVNASAQTAPSWTRALQLGGTKAEQVLATVVDASGNTYHTGYFLGTTQVGAFSLSVGGSATFDMYLVKTDAQGNVQWVRQAGSQINPTQTIYGTAQGSQLALDAAGNVYVSGFFNGSVTFGSTATTLTSNTSAPGIFVARYTPQGAVSWTRKLQATSQADAPGLAFSTGGDLYVAGYFVAALTDGTTTLTGQNNSADVFLAKYTSTGSLLWLQAAGGLANDYGVALQPAPGNGVYLQGTFNDAMSLGTVSLQSSGLSDVFVARYDDQGVVQWARAFGGTDYDYAGALAISLAGEVYSVGSFRGSVQVGSQTLVSAGVQDGFLTKYTASGAPIWARQLGGYGNESVSYVQQQPAGPLYIGGSFEGNCAFGNVSLTSAGGSDAFIARYDQAGTCVWAAQGGGPQNDRLGGLASSSSSALWLSIQFAGTAQLGNLSLTSRGDTDVALCQLQDNTTLAQRSAIDAAQVVVNPNPVTSASLRLTGLGNTAAIGTLRILSLTGSVVLARQLPTASVQQSALDMLVDISGLAAGQYIVELVTQGQSTVQKFVVQ